MEKQITILFNQIMTYFNFRRKIDKLLEGSLKKDENTFKDVKKEVKIEEEKSQNKENKNKIYQNEFCLIDTIWINKWKKYIDYNAIIKQISKNKISKDDFKDIKPIIEKHFTKSILLPLNMSKIYKNNKLDINSNFDIFYRKIAKLFFPENLIEEPLMIKCYPVRFFKNKYIIDLDDNTFQIIFKEEKTNQFFEILIIFKQAGKDKSKVLREFENEYTNIWLQKLNFKITSDLEKEITIYECIITISNKTLKLKKELTSQKNRNAANLHNSLLNYNSQISNKNRKSLQNKFNENKEFANSQLKISNEINEKKENLGNNNSNLNNGQTMNNNANGISSNNFNGKNGDVLLENNNNIHQFDNQNNTKNINQNIVNEVNTELLLHNGINQNQKKITIIILII